MKQLLLMGALSALAACGPSRLARLLPGGQREWARASEWLRSSTQGMGSPADMARDMRAQLEAMNAPSGLRSGALEEGEMTVLEGSAGPQEALLPEERCLLEPGSTRAEALGELGADGALLHAAAESPAGRKAELKAPVLESLLRSGQAGGARASSLASRARRAYLAGWKSYAAWRGAVRTVLWGGAAGLALSALAALLLSAHGAARFLAGAGAAAARLWLAGLSLAVAGFAFAGRANLWSALPAEAVGPAVLCLAACSFVLRAVDPNHPAWNQFMRGCLYPVASAALAVGIERAGVLL